MKKTQLERKVQREYSRCQEIEGRWEQRFRKNTSVKWHMELVSALDLCNKICKTLAQPSLRKIVVCSTEVPEGAGACYFKGEIHISHGFISFTTLIHELTHHFGQPGHGPNFCEVEDMIFSVAYTELTGKQPKKDW